MDCSRIGELAAEAMEELGDRFDQDDDTVRTVALVVEVDRPTHTGMMIKSSEDRAWVLEAFLYKAAEWVDEQSQVTPDPADGETEE